MSIEPGDKVKFLNDVGGGIVKNLEGGLAFVEDEDGFEIPMPVYELVVVEKGQPSAETRQVADKVVESRNEDVSEPEAYHQELEEEGHDDFNPRFYLGFIKIGNNQTEEGKLRLYVINDSNYYVTYLISELREDGLMYALHQGILQPNTKLPLEDRLAREFENIFHMQLILFRKGKGYPALDPVSSAVQIKARRFYKDNVFRNNDFFYQPAVLVPVIKNELEQKMDMLTEFDSKAVIGEKEKSEKKPQAKRKSTPELEEVDLHIDELVDTTAGLSNSDIIQIQMDKFHFVMESNAKNKGRKIVFIHGVGNGVLKNEIRKQLERKYKVYYQDASFREYGYGATMVII